MICSNPNLNEEILGLFLDHKAIVDKTSIFNCLVGPNFSKKMLLMLTENYSGEGLNDDEMLNIHCSSESVKEEIIDHFMEKKLDVNKLNSNNLTPIQMLCWNKSSNPRAVKLMIEKYRADLNVKTKDEYSNNLLHLSTNTENKNTETIKLLIESKLDPNELNEKGVSCLWKESNHYNPNTDNIQLLLEKQSDPNLFDPRTGQNPLHRTALQSKSLRACQLLIDHKADLHLKDQQTKRSALHFAVIGIDKQKSLKVLELLIENGADVLDEDEYKISAFFYIEEKEIESIIFFLCRFPSLIDLIHKLSQSDVRYTSQVYQDLIQLYQTQKTIWSTQRHCFFPTSFRSCVFSLLCCNKSLGIFKIPKPLIAIIISQFSILFFQKN